MWTLYYGKFAPLSGVRVSRVILFAVLTLAIGGVSTTAWAEESLRCPPLDQEAMGPRGATSPNDDSPGTDEDSHGFRRLAAPFAPAVALRVWYQSRTQIRGRARAYVITKAARPDQILSVVHEPFGWQVSLSWNLVDIARTLLPGDETPLRLYASDCVGFEQPMEALFEYGMGDALEDGKPDEDVPDARGDLQ